MKHHPGLSRFSKICLELTVKKFPEFEPSLTYPMGDYFIWVSEIPWPSGSPHSGLRTSTHHSSFGEEFRIDIGNWHSHSGDYGKTGSFEFLEEPFKYLRQFVDEEIVLVMRWLNAQVSTDIISDPEYQPEESFFEKYPEIWVRSWFGKHDREWKKPDQK